MIKHSTGTPVASGKTARTADSRPPAPRRIRPIVPSIFKNTVG